MTTQLAPGATAPAFELSDATGATIALSDFQGTNVVVYFYPKAATPGCTTEACDFRDSLASLKSAGYSVLGISPDPADSLQAFTAEHGLNFPLLSDEGSAVAAAYGAWGDKVVNGETVQGVLRTTVVIDDGGQVVSAEYSVAAEGHVRRLRESLGLS
ncbi:thioredoxin-dependent thiol peroxidase [Arthrobacter sp. 35W]|uniref:thioredoxin-dependent thiol peroxidase n=1 Tax=Arthrobacter sp. 35W TaxID=1132441 RepID=UPI0003FD789B|nr:thioredoxin-dependent thiol peroxidase [Arthrobacter sp. 35W]